MRSFVDACTTRKCGPIVPALFSPVPSVAVALRRRVVTCIVLVA